MTAGLLRLQLLRDRYRDHPAALAALFTLALLAAALSAAASGAVRVPWPDLPSILRDLEHPLHAAVVGVRLPRIAGGALVGASLAVAGALMQTVVRNPLADPGLIGVTGSAGFAALVGIVLFPEQIAWLPVLAFGGGLVSVLCLTAAAGWQGGRGGPLRIILTGVALQSLFFAAIAVLTFFYADRAPAFVSFTVGSLNGLGWAEARLVAIPTVVGFAAALMLSRTLNVMLLDDVSAGSVGLGVQGARLSVSAVAALLAAGAVSVAGLVGFVGLVVPNATRLLVGPDHRALTPLCALGGATLVVFADTVARSLAAPLELPVGALLAAFGAPYFLYLLWKKLA